MVAWTIVGLVGAALALGLGGLALGSRLALRDWQQARQKLDAQPSPPRELDLRIWFTHWMEQSTGRLRHSMTGSWPALSSSLVEIVEANAWELVLQRGNRLGELLGPQIDAWVRKHGVAVVEETTDELSAHLALRTRRGAAPGPLALSGEVHSQLDAANAIGPVLAGIAAAVAGVAASISTSLLSSLR
jgi:hypothetical protein